jgi:hypothetical protein
MGPTMVVGEAVRIATQAEALPAAKVLVTPPPCTARGILLVLVCESAPLAPPAREAALI